VYAPCTSCCLHLEVREIGWRTSTFPFLRKRQNAPFRPVSYGREVRFPLATIPAVPLQQVCRTAAPVSKKLARMLPNILSDEEGVASDTSLC
jgi:hypothetical protein